MRLALAFVVLFPVAAHAAPTVYLCHINGNGRDGFQDQLVIAHEADTGVVSVSDALIMGVTGGPILGALATENATRIVYTWTVPNVPATGGQVASLAYRATIFKHDLALTISMKPLNYDNSFSAQGTCTLQ